MERWPQALSEIHDQLQATALRLGLPADVAANLARQQCVDLATYAEGRSIYLPNGQRVRNELRDQEIYRRYNGRNMPELVKHYRLTEVRIYQIIDEQRSNFIKDKQPTLFAV